MREWLDNHHGPCPMPVRDCPPGPCKCREFCRPRENTVSGYQRRLESRMREIAREELKAVEKFPPPENA